MAKINNGLAKKIREERSRSNLKPLAEDLLMHIKLNQRQGDIKAIEAMTVKENKKIHTNTISKALETGMASPKTLKALIKFYGQPVKAVA